MSPKINILFIESGASGGGSFESLYQHLRVIDRELFNPVVVYLNNNRYIGPVKELGIAVYLLDDWLYKIQVETCGELILNRMTGIIGNYMPVFYIPFFRITHRPLLDSIERIVYREEIDLIHLNDQIKRDLFGLFVAQKTNVPCVSHLRSMRSGNFGQRSADFANRYVSAFVANSNSTKQYWEALGIDGDKIQVVHNAISREQIKPVDIRAAWKIDDGVRFLIGCVGSLAGGKGHDFLLRSFAKFAKLRPDVVLFLAGEGLLREELVRQTINLGIRDRVIFTGYLADAKDFIAGLDLLVLPSQTEAFGRVLLEAMAAGTPVAATDVGGVPEVVKHGYNGLLVDYGDEEGLRKAMSELLDDNRLRAGAIENGHKTAAQFSIENYSASLEQIYRDVIEGHR
ncbi:MAG: glycosyltransferase family 4 protein [Nitrospirae bacterium]|nr:glycosyltransferase family 4 protein [Nitrospirota bacterium]